MTESKLEIRNRLRAGRPRFTITQQHAPAVAAATEVITTEADPTFLLENADSGRTILTTPLRESAQVRAMTLELSGRMVEAENANRNGAFWSQGDLEVGLPTVGYGPLNWLHDDKKVLGCLINPTLVSAEAAAAEGVGPYIRTDAQVWSWIYPEESRAIERHVAAGDAWMSMECISEAIQCVGPDGCGRTMPYGAAQAKPGTPAAEQACAHVLERSSHRRLVNPTFLGAAVVLPPYAPGWANADLRKRTAAEAAIEESSLHVAGISDDDAALMVARIMAWSGR